MLRWALIFFIVTIVATTFGFAGLALTSMGIASLLLVIFLASLLIRLVLHKKNDPAPAI